MLRVLATVQFRSAAIKRNQRALSTCQTSRLRMDASSLRSR